MIANYHAHTFRCHHASGTEVEYVEQALRNGLQVLGFSDHAPMPFPSGYRSNFRVDLDAVDGYFDTLLALRERYRGQIDILIGFEAEYYPAAFPAFLDLIRRYPVDYLIMGQHFPGNEENEAHVITPNPDPVCFERYTNQVIEGMRTGRYSYVAHPDMYHFTGDETVYRTQVARLCRAAKALDLPLELNLLGLSDGRCYPRREFWEVAAETGAKAIIGCDAHSPDRVGKPAEVDAGLAFLRAVGITPLEKLEKIVKPV